VLKLVFDHHVLAMVSYDVIYKIRKSVTQHLLQRDQSGYMRKCNYVRLIEGQRSNMFDVGYACNGHCTYDIDP
jgi:hypothetical protein